MSKVHYLLVFVLLTTSGYISGSLPQEAEDTTEWKPFDISEHRGTLADLAKLREKRHTDKLQEQKLQKLGCDKTIIHEPTIIIAVKEKPACTCTGCFSRTCKLVVALFSCCLSKASMPH